MAGLPGSPASMLPAGDDELVRRMRDLERRVDELGPSVARSVTSIVENMVKPQAIYDHYNGFGLTAFGATIRTISVPVPVGFTSAAVMATSRLYAINPTLSADRIIAFTNISPGSGHAADLLPSDLAPASGGSAINISPMTATLTGLTPGGTFNITVEGGSLSADWAANYANTLEVTAMILWLR